MNRTFAEPMVARVTGVAKKRLVGLRKANLQRGVDWDLERAVVVYTQAGLGKILVLLGLAEESLSWPAAGAAHEDTGSVVESGIEATDGAAEATLQADQDVPPDEKNRVVAAIAAAVVAAGEGHAVAVLRVTRRALNPHIVFAKEAEGEAEVLVKVASNEHFIPGMEVQARPSSPHSTLYYLEGRCPRWRGRW